MRIERHQVGQATVSAARDDFANRIGGQIRSMSKAGPIATYEWQWIAQELLAGPPGVRRATSLAPRMSPL